MHVSLPNGRDLGGLPAAGGRTHRGVLFRSAAPADAALLPELERLGIRTVIDLRTDEERDSQPLVLPTGTEVVRANVLADRPSSGAASLGAIAAAALSGEGELDVDLGDLTSTMLTSYRQFVELPSGRRATGEALQAIAEARGPVLVHCTAGKDRTGWVIALALHAAGVGQGPIEDDYLASGPAITKLFEPFRSALAERGLDPDLLAPALAVTPGYLGAARAAATRAAGGIQEYVAAVGADAVALRDRLVAPPDAATGISAGG